MPHSHRIVPPGRPAADRILMPAEMAAADRHAIEQLAIPGVALMENASRHVARAVAARCPPGGRVAVICGGGNNGGDGFGAARHLVAWGRPVELWLTRAPARYAGDAATNLESCRRLGLKPHIWGDDGPPDPQRFAWIIDAVLGTGLSGEVRGAAGDAIRWMNRAPAPVLAVDIPSGIDGATGAVCGVAVEAAHTVTFATSKPGHWLFPGAGRRGTLEIVDIGMPPACIERTPARRWLMGDAELAPALAARPRDAHKGRQGHVYVLGGAPGRTGAVRMCADAAMRAGAGLATIGAAPDAAAALGPALYETMVEALLDRSADAITRRLADFDAVAVGPGLDPDDRVGAVLAEALPAVERPMVIDADGLNHAARRPAIARGRIITPHPGEAGRLLGCATAEIQRDRLAAAAALAEAFDATVVLKGAHTIVHAADGVAVCPDGHPGMATAGAGDVLTGVIAALLARGLPPGPAARAGVLWHARAGAHAARSGAHHMLARDIISGLAAVERGAGEGGGDRRCAG